MNYREEEKQIVGINEAGEAQAWLKFHMIGENLLSIDSIVVNEAQRGKGIAAALLAEILNKAKLEKKKILPRCSYAKEFFSKNPAYQALEFFEE